MLVCPKIRLRSPPWEPVLIAAACRREVTEGVRVQKPLFMQFCSLAEVAQGKGLGKHGLRLCWPLRGLWSLA